MMCNTQKYCLIFCVLFLFCLHAGQALCQMILVQSFTEQNISGDTAFGYSVSGAGDVNSDGYDDVIVGAPYFGGLSNGKAYVCTLEAPSTITQQITIQNGKLNLISFYVIPETPDASAVFDGLTHFVVAFNDDGEYRIPPNIVFPGHPGTNTIGDVDPCEGYSIFISGDTPQTLSVTGLPIDAASLVCTVDNGKLNKTAFPKQSIQPISDVFNATVNAALWPDLVVVFDDEGQYFIPPDIVFPGHPGTNTIGDMNPGKGYSLYHSGDAPINYTLSPPSDQWIIYDDESYEGYFNTNDEVWFVLTLFDKPAGWGNYTVAEVKINFNTDGNPDGVMPCLWDVVYNSGYYWPNTTVYDNEPEYDVFSGWNTYTVDWDLSLERFCAGYFQLYYATDPDPYFDDSDPDGRAYLIDGPDGDNLTAHLFTDIDWAIQVYVEPKTTPEGNAEGSEGMWLEGKKIVIRNREVNTQSQLLLQKKLERKETGMRKKF